MVVYSQPSTGERAACLSGIHRGFSKSRGLLFGHPIDTGFVVQGLVLFGCM